MATYRSILGDALHRMTQLRLRAVLLCFSGRTRSCRTFSIREQLTIGIEDGDPSRRVTLDGYMHNASENKRTNDDGEGEHAGNTTWLPLAGVAAVRDAVCAPYMAVVNLTSRHEVRAADGRRFVMYAI